MIIIDPYLGRRLAKRPIFSCTWTGKRNRSRRVGGGHGRGATGMPEGREGARRKDGRRANLPLVLLEVRKQPSNLHITVWIFSYQGIAYKWSLLVNECRVRNFKSLFINADVYRCVGYVWGAACEGWTWSPTTPGRR